MQVHKSMLTSQLNIQYYNIVIFPDISYIIKMITQMGTIVLWRDCTIEHKKKLKTVFFKGIFILKNIIKYKIISCL